MKPKPQQKIWTSDKSSYFRLPQKIISTLQRDNFVYLEHKGKLLVLLRGEKALDYLNNH